MRVYGGGGGEVFSLLDLLSGGVWLPGSSDAVSRHVVSEMSLPVEEDPARGGGQPWGREAKQNTFYLIA